MSNLKTVSVTANMADGFAINSVIDGHTVQIDQPVAAKGTGTGPTPLHDNLSHTSEVVHSLA
ncbi:MAG TPA: hypothetical protein VIN66_04370 [Rheinheimera sp.]|uniref:OsmC family protein n=1 Tax=Rheinheimera sp. TaxID=1869214 RepID=UPI002F940E07